MPNGRFHSSTPRQPTERDRDIASFAEKYFGNANPDIYAEMMVTLCRLARDEANRGDAKLLNRALAELRYGLKVFAPFRDTRKISIFGSSRTPEDHPDYRAAVHFARLIGKQGWMVITGAGDGIMKAGHGGAGREASFGVAIRLPFEQKTNDIIAEDSKLVNFRYFFTRKLMFVKEASAIALFPGGFGTLDEGFEALTLIQTGKTTLLPVVLCEQRGGRYWGQWREYVVDHLLKTGMISQQDMNLFDIFDDPAAAVDRILSFYRVFHSMRYVGPDLVIRLNRMVSAETIERLNDEFARHLLVSGRIEATPILSGENDEFPQLPRLKMAFDKRNHGWLRMMVDRINADQAGLPVAPAAPPPDSSLLADTSPGSANGAASES